MVQHVPEAPRGRTGPAPAHPDPWTRTLGQRDPGRTTPTDLIGAGWAYPAQVAPDGSVLLSRGSADLDGAIRIIVSTRIGERVMRPEFGCRIWDYLFEPVNARTLGLVEEAVREALARWEPRIELTEVTARAGGEPADGVIGVAIGYQVRATADRRSLVFPFYTIPREVTP